MADLMERYFNYLAGLVESERALPDPIGLYILRTLYKRSFWSMTPNDDNRSSDGLVLREVYKRETGDDSPDILGSCTMLEMMIGLARRMEQEMKDGLPDEENTTGRWFWEMIRNLGLYSAADDLAGMGMQAEGLIDLVNSKVDTVLERGYDSYGRGGLFPLKHYVTDQRRVEIWFQMQAWLMQNY